MGMKETVLGNVFTIVHDRPSYGTGNLQIRRFEEARIIADK